MNVQDKMCKQIRCFLVMVCVIQLGLALLVSGQLLSASDINEPPVYLADGPSDELMLRQPIAYLSLPEQRSSSIIRDSLIGYQSPLLETLAKEQLLARLSELRRQGNSGLQPSSNYDIDLEESTSNSVDENLLPSDRISPPVNDPLEFEAAANLVKLAPSAQLAVSAGVNGTDDLFSLDTLISSYIGNLVNEAASDSSDLKQAANKDATNNDILGMLDGQQHQPAATATSASGISRHEKSITSDGKSATPPASRYGNAEYIDHPLAIIGHQYVQGGAGEGKQLLGPDGTFENVQVIKSDHAVPSYCDPPNPCPIGFTAEDGCLENFINSASFSREYQAKQQCSCDNEHSLFNCASPVSTLKGDFYSTGSPSAPAKNDDHDDDNDISSSSSSSNSDDDDEKARLENKIDRLTGGADSSRLETLARTIQNRFGSLSSIQNLVAKQHEES